MDIEFELSVVDYIYISVYLTNFRQLYFAQYYPVISIIDQYLSDHPIRSSPDSQRFISYIDYTFTSFTLSLNDREYSVPFILTLKYRLLINIDRSADLIDSNESVLASPSKTTYNCRFTLSLNDREYSVPERD